MVEIFVDADRPPKRQRIDCGPDRTRPAFVDPDYLCLVTYDYNISTDETDVYKALTKCPAGIEAEISEVITTNDGAVLWLKIPALKISTKFTSNYKNVDVLTCATKLPSSLKRLKATSIASLAKYLATVALEGDSIILSLQVLWYDNAIPRHNNDLAAQEIFQLLRSMKPYVAKPTEIAWDVKEFYDNVHVPQKTDELPLSLNMMQCKLYPFQERATRWLLAREGVEVCANGHLQNKKQNSKRLPLDFVECADVNDRPYYASRCLNVASSSLSQVEDQYSDVKGGLLAEAMGLGKTVEMIALMCLHRKEQSPAPCQNPSSLVETGATLIITPPTILEQWKQELREHAPGLRVYHYSGTKAASKRKSDIITILADQDVVLTTYSVIASEIHYVQEKPDRNLRNRPRREAPKSPLTQILWWRCLLDEAQMIESGVSNAAVVARLIPRVNAWAVTGTPLKQSHRDLYGLLLFLRYAPWSQSAKLWDYLVSSHRESFRKMINSIALRHSKEAVREELRIPPQARRTVTIPFSAVEESHYTQMHFDMQQDVGLDSSGSPLDGDWNPNDPVTVEKMRSWLQRLRQTCLHPEVGGRNRRALGKKGGGPLRTVAQVLDVMIEQTESTIHTERRNMLMSKADKGRMLEHARESKVAQAIFEEAYQDASIFVQECRKDLHLETEKIHTTKKISSATVVDDNSDEEEEEDEESDSSLTIAKQRLRSALEVQHICIFFIGNTYFQIRENLTSTNAALHNPERPAGGLTHVDAEKHTILGVELQTPVVDLPGNKVVPKPGAQVESEITMLEKLEADAYEEAKKIRTELLAEAHHKALRKIKTIRNKKDTSSFVTFPSLSYSEDEFGGIESRKIFEKVYKYCTAMNEQARQFTDIRARMVEMLSKALIDEEDNVELTGEEYEDSTKHQDEMYVIMEMLRALFADRSDAITGQENLLLRQETKQWLRAAREGEGPAPELMIKLLAERQEKKIDPSQQGSLRGILTEIRSLASALEWQESSSTRAKAELSIVNSLLKHVQNLQAEQTKSVAVLEQEVNMILDTMNSRLDYFRALQVVSDMVAPIGADEDVGKPANPLQIENKRVTEEAAAKKLSAATAKRRYLLHLRDEQASDGETKICTICQFEFDVGTLTVCGHQFCKDCITLWWSEHKNCPVCKRKLQLTDFYNVTLKPIVNDSSVEEHTTEEARSQNDQQSNSIYASITSSTLQRIQAIDLRGSSYGSKVDTLVRHVLHLRKNDPGSKAVIFSQYRDFLDVLSRSLRDNGIVHSKFDDKDGIIDFKSNPANECFLLHAKAHSAGLNLVCASHVILCEPLINTAIELQAVARVHRIGQVRETCVWMYLIEDTVEEAIYDISVKRRLAHMDNRSRDVSRNVSRSGSPTRDETMIEAANAKELQIADTSKMFASGKTGGELVDKEDLWLCLFGKAKKSSGRSLPTRGVVNLGAANDVAVVGAGSEVGRFLRAEAADRRTELRHVDGSGLS